MMKFFRKYNKQMLAVFMALLLVVWLGGAALSSLFHPDEGSRLFAQTRFGPIRYRDINQAQSDVQLLDDLRLPWNFMGSTPIDHVDWLLLVREADDLGMHVDRDQAEDFLTKARGIDPGSIQAIAHRRNIKPEAFYDQVANFMKVQRLISHVLDTTSLSEAELRTATRDYFETVKIQAVVLSTATFQADQQSFSEDQIREQFVKAREQERGRGMTFGYFLPPKVKVQYVKVDHAKVQEDLRPGESTLIRRARSYWEENKEKDPAFLRPKDNAAQTQPFPPQDQSKYFQTFEEAQTTAIAAARKEIAADEAAQPAEAVIRGASEPWFDAQAGADGYKNAPDPVKVEDYYDRLISSLPASMKHRQALSVVTTDWLTKEQARVQPGIGSARTAPKSGPSVDFATLAFNVQGLEKLPSDPQADRSHYLSVYQSTAEALRDAEGNLYIFRVVAVEPAHAPESVDLVRDQVIEDLKLKAAYDQARQAADALANAAQAGGLKSAWEADESIRSQVQPPDGFVDPEPFPRKDPIGLQLIGKGVRFSRPIPDLGDVDDEFRAACFALGERTAGEPRVAVIPQPQLSMVVVVEWLQTTPMTKQQYQQQRDKLRLDMERARSQQVASAWLSSDQIRARSGFQAAGRPG